VCCVVLSVCLLLTLCCSHMQAGYNMRSKSSGNVKVSPCWPFQGEQLLAVEGSLALFSVLSVPDTLPLAMQVVNVTGKYGVRLRNTWGRVWHGGRVSWCHGRSRGET